MAWGAELVGDVGAKRGRTGDAYVAYVEDKGEVKR